MAISSHIRVSGHLCNGVVVPLLPSSGEGQSHRAASTAAVKVTNLSLKVQFPAGMSLPSGFVMLFMSGVLVL